MASLDDNVVQLIAQGDIVTVDPVGTNYKEARQQAKDIINNSPMLTETVLTVLITKIQQQAKSIEMFEYNQRWRKRRP